jgi:hypothetical protein
MNKRTWEVIAKYISEEMGLKIVISAECSGPKVDLSTNTIHVPERIKEENALAALTSFIHEAGHIKFSKNIPHDMSDDSTDHYILNGFEDARIDRKCFNILPNIREFYDIFYKDHFDRKEHQEEILKQPMLVRCVLALILNMEWFDKYVADIEAVKFIQEKGLQGIFNQGISAIDREDWPDLKTRIKEFRSFFDDPNATPEEKQKMLGADGQGQGDSDKLLHPASVWDKGPGLPGPAGEEFTPKELTEITKQLFKNALDIKEKTKDSEANNLNTDNLMSFFTGETEELFESEDTEKVKKSKIVFCLDGSGSMKNVLLGNKRRQSVLAKSVSALIDVLEEIKQNELDVDYEIIGFDCYPRLLNKETWLQDYKRIHGGTDLIAPVRMAIDLLSQAEIDGNKIIILVTDGEVSQAEIDEVERTISQNNGEIKAMLLGIGAKPTQTFLSDNILVAETADQIIMEAIQKILE